MKIISQLLSITLFFLFFSCGSNDKTEHPDIKDNGVIISYTDSGDGDTTLLFVHGWCIDKNYWKEQENYFNKKYRVVTLDLGGHGASGHNRNSWTIKDFAEDVLSVINGLDLKNIILIGHSMGGDVILEVANDIPEKISGFVGVDNFKDVAEEITPEQETGIDAFLKSIKTNYKETIVPFSRTSLFPPDYSDTVAIQRVLNDIKEADTVMAVQAIESVIAYKEPGGLSKLRVPLHLIVSDYTPTNETALKKYCKAGFSVDIINGTGHYPMIEKPETFNLQLQKVLWNISDANETKNITDILQQAQ